MSSAIRTARRLRSLDRGQLIAAGFIQVAQDVSGQDLAEFFDAWLYSQEVLSIPEMGLGGRAP